MGITIANTYALASSNSLLASDAFSSIDNSSLSSLVNRKNLTHRLIFCGTYRSIFTPY